MSPDTIVALSSAHGRAGVAVVRVSGPAAGSIVDAVAPPRPKPRQAALRLIRRPGTGDVIDEGLVLFFPAPSSATGEDVAEFHVHGGRAVIQAVLSSLLECPGCRLADPGEFARRAFSNGKIDLTAAEGLADLVWAETEGQRRQALRQAGGALSRLYDGWRQSLIAAQARIEAGIDFADEGDVDDDGLGLVRGRVAVLRDEIVRHLGDGRRGEILRDGFQVVLVGPPNAGKSSLLNALARRDAAIVSAEAGTTRDVIEVRLDLDGLPVIVADTAGVREAEGEVEREGIRRTLEKARTADLVVHLIDGGARTATPEAHGGDGDLLADVFATGVDRLAVMTKSDLSRVRFLRGHKSFHLAVSAFTGEGMDALAKAIADRARARIGDAEYPALTQARHRSNLETCRDALTRFLEGDASRAELAAEDLRVATSAIGRITGRVDVEDVLDQVFGQFCIGK